MATVLGIDVSTTGLAAAPVDTVTGDLLTDVVQLAGAPLAEPDAFTSAVFDAARTFDWTGPVGVTFPGLVERGAVRRAPTLDHAWIGRNLDVTLTSALGAPATVVDASDAVGMAEVEFGAGRRVDGVVVVLVVGDTVGSAVLVDGVLLPHVELGRLEIRDRSAEQRVSYAARVRKGLSWGRYAERVDEVLATVTALLHPDLVLLAGPAADDAEQFLPLLATTTPVAVAALGPIGGLTGAAVAAARARFARIALVAGG